MDKLIATNIDDKILEITLNRPDKLNSFTDSMAQQFQEVLGDAGENKEVRCILLTGAGKAFCAGQDLSEVIEKGENHELGDTVRRNYNPVIKAIRQIPKPVVGAVNGTAAGAGANIAFACDLVLASGDATFVQSFSKIGLLPDSGGTFFLPRLVGLQRSNIFYLLDDKISSQKAVDIGLIYKVSEPGKLMAEARSLCSKLASMPTKGFGLYKQSINQSFNNTLEEQLELEAKLQTEAGNTRDYREGVEAFMEKRKPEFTGE